MKVRRLKKLLRRAEVRYDGVIEKRDLVEKACIATPGCHIPKAHNRHEPTQTQNSDHYKASESKLVSQILRKLHSKLQQLETDMIQHRIETQHTIDAIRTNFSQQLSRTTNPRTAEHNQGEADSGSNGLPLPLWESDLSDLSDLLWVLWVVVRLVSMLAALFLVNLFVWKVLILLFTRISAAVQQPARQVAPRVPTPTPTPPPTPAQAVNGRNGTFPPEATTKSQPSTAPDKEKCVVKGVSVEEQPLLSQLESMGFGNKASILKALEDANGDVSAAALALASRSSHSLTKQQEQQQKEQQASQDAPETPGLQLLEDLREMGFSDIQANTVAIAEADGNLTLAIKRLVAQERADRDVDKASNSTGPVALA